MTVRIFISFDHDDAAQVNGFRGLISNPNHPLDAYDRSLREPVRDAWGRPLTSAQVTRAPTRSSAS